MDLGGDIDVVYCDFMKAFDKVPHKRLIQTLEHYGIQGVTKDWIKDFLKNRKQRVVVNGTTSEWQEVTSGIPQGSVLGPILFVIYINMLPEMVVSSDIYLFADDVAIFRPIFDNNDTDPLQKDLNLMDEWTEKSLLKFNYQKCSTMRIGRHYETKEYTMGHGTQIFKRVEEEKYLGVIIDNTLSFDKHMSQKINEANSVMGTIRRMYSYLDKESFLLLYKALVRPHRVFKEAYQSYRERAKEGYETGPWPQGKILSRKTEEPQSTQSSIQTRSGRYD